MPALSSAHRAAFMALVDQCPDAVLGTMARLVPTLGGGAKGAELAALMTAEITTRRRRATAFSPLLPLFRPRTDGVEGLNFPPVLIGRLWKAAIVGHEVHLEALDSRDQSLVPVADRLCRAAAGALRDRPDEIWPPNLVPDAREVGLAELAGCLDLAPLARTAARQLPGWLSVQADDGAGLRLLLRDATDVAPDGTTRLLEIIFAHLDEAPAILRIITRTSTAATREQFLHGTELAGFVSRIVAAVRTRTEGATFDPEGGRTAVAATLDDLRWAADALTQIDISLDRDPAGDWSRAIDLARRALSARLNVWIRDADRAVRAAAPRTRVKLGARSSRHAPDLDGVLDPAAAARAVTHAVLLSSLRGPAATFGCEMDRRTSVDEAVVELSDWADEALQAVNSGEVADWPAAIARIEHAIDVLAALDAGETARALRRRVAVAGAPGSDLRTA